LSYLETNNFNMKLPSQPSMLGLGFRWAWSICHFKQTNPYADNKPGYSHIQDINSNSLIGVKGISRASGDLLKLAFYFVLMLGKQWLETLVRLNIMVFNPGGWAVP
jgi:hypothetical protein